MVQLIEHKFHQIDLGKAHSNALDSCKELNEMIKKMDNLTTEPESDFIQEYFNK